MTQNDPGRLHVTHHGYERTKSQKPMKYPKIKITHAFADGCVVDAVAEYFYWPLPPTPHPRAMRWHVQYMWSTCEVRTHARPGRPTPPLPTHFKRSRGLKVTQVQRHFWAKKKFNDSAPSIDGALNLLMNKNQAKAEVRCGELFCETHSMLRIFGFFGNPIPHVCL